MSVGLKLVGGGVGSARGGLVLWGGCEGCGVVLVVECGGGLIAVEKVVVISGLVEGSKAEC